jgi:hypothetical protein
MATEDARPAYRIPENADVIKLIEDAKKAFYKDPNVIGVGVGERRKENATRHGEVALIVYVKTKLPEGTVNPDYRIPASFQGMATDVVAPFSADAPKEALGFAESHQQSDDMSFIDWPRLHEQWMAAVGGNVPFHGQVQDFGDVCVIQDDGTLIQTVNGQPVVDFVRAYQLFRTTHPDIYDFVTFFTDSANGMPPQGGSSWYRFVYNDTNGIGLGPHDYRAGYGSSVLQGVIFINQGHFPLWRYVMLQEQEHRWAAFARYKTSAGDPVQTGHLLGGWGHWADNFDDDESPMDYDIHDWVQNGLNFDRVTLDSAKRTYCNLDLYLMGLLGPEEVGDFYLLSNVTLISGILYSADKKALNVHNIILAEGDRAPSVASSPKLFKNAFIVLTKDNSKVHDLVNTVDGLRRRFEVDFSDATKRLGRVDTTLGALSGELNPSQVQELSSGGYTTLHRHLVGINDTRITGTQFTGTLNPGQSQRWFTQNWLDGWVVNWSVRPTTSAGKLAWSEEIERAVNGTFTYWITVRNVGNVRTAFEAKYAAFR